MRRLQPLAFALLCTLALPVSADFFKWTDTNGQTHFGDTPPANAKNITPLDTPKANVLKMEKSEGTTDSKARMERQKRMTEVLQQEAQDRENAAQNAADEKEQRDKECAKLRQQLKAMDGMRLFTTDENGQREYIDDASRNAYIAEINKSIETNCQ
jgi:hypothetical protein